MGRLDVSFQADQDGKQYKHRDYPLNTEFKIVPGPGYVLFQILDGGVWISEFTTPGDVLVRAVL